jgi:hypothetical protein
MKDIDEVVAALVATRKWSEPAARRGAKAGFRCEYCGRDMLASAEHYKMWQDDHLIPQSKHDSNEEHNLLVSCWLCNAKLKGKWDPRTECGHNATREQLSQAARTYIRKIETQTEEEVSVFRRIARGERDRG